MRVITIKAFKFDELSEKAKNVAVGDVVLFRYKGKHLLHRIVAIDGDRYTLRGDNCSSTETAKGEDIVAKMVVAEKKHLTLKVNISVMVG